MDINEDMIEEAYEDDEIIELVSDEGETIKFFDIATIPYNGKVYKILQPVELFENMEDDQALVFEILDDEGIEMVDNDEIIDAVFAEYEKLYIQEFGEDEEE